MSNEEQDRNGSRAMSPDEALERATSHVFRGQTLHPLTHSRKMKARRLGAPIYNKAGTMNGGEMVDSAAVVIFLCTLSAGAVHRAKEEDYFQWIDVEGVDLDNEGETAEMVSLLAEMIDEIDASRGKSQEEDPKERDPVQQRDSEDPSPGSTGSEEPPVALPDPSEIAPSETT